MDEAKIVERPRPATGAAEVETSIKTVLLHVQNDAGLQRRLQTALALARTTRAHLDCIQITPIEAYVTTATLGGLLTLDRAMQEVDSEDDALESRTKANLATSEVSWNYEHVTGYEATEVIRRAALADLVILGRDAHLARAQRPQLAVLGDILTDCRTPLLIPGTSNDFNPSGSALVAWNGSYEAANAVRAAIGMLKLASQVRVVRYTQEKAGTFPDIRLTEYLSRHDIHVELDVRAVRRDYASDLVEDATASGASYVVMGGYSHSRAGEFLFGGVTRELLRDCPVSLLISH